jgi:hypothetical protein
VPYFMIERNFAEELVVPLEDAADVNLINDEEDVRWLYSFLSIDHRKSYCVYEAPSIDAIRVAAERAGMPADAIVEVAGRVLPSGELAPLSM